MRYLAFSGVVSSGSVLVYLVAMQEPVIQCKNGLRAQIPFFLRQGAQYQPLIIGQHPFRNL
jgi:hypothetical protein